MRKIPVEMTLRLGSGNTIALDIRLQGYTNISATATAGIETISKSNTSQAEARKKTLGKLGDTPYSLEYFNDLIGDLFIPMSVLTALRRDVTKVLDDARKAAYRYEYRAKSISPCFDRDTLVYNDNVANKLSRNFYRKAGVKDIEESLETMNPSNQRRRVMKTRYCLRRELDKCLRTPQGRMLEGPIKLKGANFTLDVEFDCNNCEMSIFTRPIKK